MQDDPQTTKLDGSHMSDEEMVRDALKFLSGGYAYPVMERFDRIILKLRSLELSEEIRNED